MNEPKEWLSNVIPKLRPWEVADLQVMQKIRTKSLLVSWRVSEVGHSFEITRRESQSDD
jgi:prolyl-tRNA synthetase